MHLFLKIRIKYYLCLNKKKIMKKLIIFDLDGTLLDTIADLANATNQALAYYGYPTHPIDSFRIFVGNGINKLFERALPENERTTENILRIRNRFLPFYNEHNADFSQPYKGIETLLADLQAKGIQLGIASNKYQAATEKLVKHYFPNTSFIEVLGQREGIPTKPNPFILSEILKKAGVQAKEALYVGDSDVDMQTGKNAGIESIGVTWGFRPRKELEDMAPLGIIDEPIELLNFI